MRPIHFNNTNFLFKVTLYDADGEDIGIADSVGVEIKLFKENSTTEEGVWSQYKYPETEGFSPITRDADLAYYFQLTKAQMETAPINSTLVVQITHAITDARFTEDAGINYITEKGKLMIVKSAL
jgi:hypothetical protein